MLHTFRLEDRRLNRTSGPEPAQGRRAASRPLAFPERDRARPASHRCSTRWTSTAGRSAPSIRRPSSTIKSAPAGSRPYDVAIARNGTQLFVSDWAGRIVRVLDPEDLRTVARIAVGEHPNQIAVHPQGRSDLRRLRVERLRLGHRHPPRDRHRDDPHGPVPQGARRQHARRPGGRPRRQDALRRQRRQQLRRGDRHRRGRTQPGQGLHPDRLVSDGGGGHAGRQEPPGRRRQGQPDQGQPDRAGRPPRRRLATAPRRDRRRLFPYIGTTLSGALSIVPIPDDKELAQYTETVYRNCPYSDKLLTDAPHPEKTAIPTKVGDPSPIKHVLYIIKENRTYDQVFGDIERGNGDPSLVMFGRDVTPNHHKLAEEFVLLDNLYCNGHVSADGHPWSTMAYNTDYIARNWALTYSSRAGIHDDDDGDLANAPSGYLWDACARAGLSYRSYGEYGRRVSQPDGSVRIEGAVPGLVGHMCPDYRRRQGPGRPGPRHRERRDLHPGIPRVRGEGHAAAVHGHEPGRGPHDRHASGHVHAEGLRRQQRPGPGPDRRGGHAQQVLARDGDLRHRGRRPERPGPRRRPSDRGPGHQPVHEAESPRQQPVQHRQHDPDDRADPGPGPALAVRRGGPADVRLVHRQGRPDAVRPRGGADRPRTRSTPPPPTAPIVR